MWMTIQTFSLGNIFEDKCEVEEFRADNADDPYVLEVLVQAIANPGQWFPLGGGAAPDMKISVEK